MDLGPRRVSASCCFMPGLSAEGLGWAGVLPAPRWGSKRGAKPAAESRSQEGKGWLAWSPGGRWGGGGQPGWQRPWGAGTRGTPSPSPTAEPAPHSPQPPCASAWGRGAGAALGSRGAASPRVAEPQRGWGLLPSALHGPDLPEARVHGFRVGF